MEQSLIQRNVEPRRGLPGAPLGAGSVPKRGGEEASDGAWGGGEGGTSKKKIPATVEEAPLRVGVRNRNRAASPR